MYAGLALTLALATARVAAGELSAGNLVAVNAYRTFAQLHLFPPMLEKRPMSSPPLLLFPPPELPTPSVTPWVTLSASKLQRNPGGVLRTPPRAAPACSYCARSASIKHAPPRPVCRARSGASPHILLSSRRRLALAVLAEIAHVQRHRNGRPGRTYTSVRVDAGPPPDTVLVVANRYARPPSAFELAANRRDMPYYLYF